MSEIKKGDLVMVVRPSPCCNGFDNCGKIGVVDGIGIPDSNFCSRCFKTRDISKPFAHLVGFPANGYVEMWRLKKIDPPSLPESTDTKEELTA